MTWRRAIWALVGLGMLALALLTAWRLPPGTWTDTVLVLSRVSVLWVVVLCLAQVMTIVILACQWTRLLARADHARPIRFLPLLLRYQAGAVVEALTPSSRLGGEAARIYLFRRRFGVGVAALSWATGIHKLCMIAALALALPIGVMAVGSREVSRVLGMSLPQLLGSLLVTVTLISLAAWGLRLWWNRLRVFRPSAGLLAELVAGGVVVWLLFVMKVALAAYALEISVSPAVLLTALFSGYLLGLLPISPGGLGPYEMGMAGVLLSAGMPPHEAAALTLLSRLITFWWSSLLAFAAWLIVAAQEGLAAGEEPPIVPSPGLSGSLQ